LESIVGKTKIPGMAAVVLRGDRIVAQGVAGVRRRGSPERITLGDKFQINSATKAMTATLVAMAIERGKLSRDTTVGEIFGATVKHMDRGWDTVTLAELLEHRGGVPNELSEKTMLLRVRFSHGSVVEKRERIVAKILSHRPAYQPGSKFVYSSLGYMVIGSILEKVEGASWEDLIRDRLWTPLGITSGGFGAPGTTGQRSEPWGHWGTLVVGHPVPPGGFWARLNTPLFWGPGGNSHMTVTDWAKFVALHLRGDPANPDHEERLVSADSFATMHRAVPGSFYESGWIVVTRSWAKGDRGGDTGRVISSQGDNDFWHSEAWVAPEIDFAVVIVMNQGGPAAKDAAKKASEEALGALFRDFGTKQARGN
jgi:CubicO group peptidase (beta-lactamase class C family)